MSELKKMLRNRLKVRKNPQYLKWLADKKTGLDRDHVLESVHGLKLNDLLIDLVPHQRHIDKHYQHGCEDFDSAFIRSLENVFDYVEYLQGKKK